MTTLADELPAQQERCRMILENAILIGPPGAFLVATLRAALRQAEQAAASGDVGAMVWACKNLQDFKK